MDEFNISAMLKPEDSFPAIANDPFTKQQIGICDLPEEVHEIIFDWLSVSDLKSVSLVCLQWSRLAFAGRRMDRTRLRAILNYKKKNPLKESQRQYRHIWFDTGDENEEMDMECIRFLQRVNKFVVSLHCSMVGKPSQIKRILLEVPNLRALSMYDGTGLMQLPVFQQLTELNIHCEASRAFETLDICTIAPNLRSITLTCDSEYTLNVYRHFSHQLKSVKLLIDCDEYFGSFCEIMFPELLEFEMRKTWCNDVSLRLTNRPFLAGSKHLHRAKLNCKIRQPIVNSLVENCPNITFLSINTDNLEGGSFIGLAKLAKLKALELSGDLYCDLFENCKPIPSLQELDCRYLQIHCGREFIKGLPTTMPHLSKLVLTLQHLAFECAEYLQCVYNNFSSLKCLTLDCDSVDLDGCFQHLDRLPNLVELNLEMIDDIDEFLQSCPSTKINELSIRWGKLNDNQLLLIPQVFPSLQKLKINECRLITKSSIAKLRSLSPGFMIIWSKNFVTRYYQNP